MLVILPFLLLFLSSALGVALHYRKVRLAYIWIFLNTIALTVWLLLIFLPYNTLKPLVLGNWFSVSNDIINLPFVINSLNWPIILMIIAIDLSFFLTTVSSSNKKKDFSDWIASQIIVALIILALSADNLWAVALCWTAYDIAVIMIKSYSNSQTPNISEFKPYFFRFIGSILLVWIIAYSGFSESIINLGSISTNLHIGLFLAALLHAGALDFGYSKQLYQVQKNFDLITHIGGVAISLLIIFRIPTPMLAPLVNLILKIIFSLVSLYSGLFCTLAQNDQKKSVYLVTAFLSSISMAFFIGNTKAGVFWLTFYILTLGLMRLFYFKNKFTLIIFFLYYIMSSGLPFTYLAYGSRGMLATEFSVFAFSMILPHVLILAELIRRCINTKEEFIEPDPWKQVVSYSGVFLPLLTLAVISFKTYSNLEAELEYWWAGVLVVLISSVITIFQVRSEPKGSSINQQTIERLNKINAWSRMANIARFFYSLMGQAVLAISNLLEGRAGMLWSVVILALLLTILRL